MRRIPLLLALSLSLASWPRAFAQHPVRGTAAHSNAGAMPSQMMRQQQQLMQQQQTQRIRCRREQASEIDGASLLPGLFKLADGLLQLAPLHGI